MKRQDVISVIVPVYNVDHYLRNCLNSILNQSYKNIEVILVDDGSTDTSGLICDEYAGIDTRIKVIHKKNEGVSSARNVGVDNASGNYIAFVDSDDYILNDYLEYLYKLQKKTNADISCCNFEFIYENTAMIKTKKQEENILEFDSKNALINLLYQKEIDTSLWGKLFESKHVKKHKFPEHKIFEDLAVFYKIVMESDKIVYSNLKKYMYLQRDNSIISANFNSSKLDIIQVVENMCSDILNVYPDIYLATESRILNMDFYLLRIIDKKNYREIYLNLKNDVKRRRKNVLNDKNIKKKTKIAIYISYINVGCVKILYNFLVKMKIMKKYIAKYKN